MSIAYKLEPYDINKLKQKKKRKNPNRYIKRDITAAVEEFVISEYDCCRIFNCDTAREAHIECTIIRRTVQLGNFDNIKVVVRGEDVYLVKKDKWEK